MIEEKPKPVCLCCRGEGMHYLRLSSAGPTPDDRDAECSTCQGSGRCAIIIRPGTCSGARSLRGALR